MFLAFIWLFWAFFCHYSFIFSLCDVSKPFLCCLQAPPMMSHFMASPITFHDVPMMSPFVVSPITSCVSLWCLLLWYLQDDVTSCPQAHKQTSTCHSKKISHSACKEARMTNKEASWLYAELFVNNRTPKMRTTRSEILQFVMWPCLSTNQKARFSQVSQILREIVRLPPPKKNI